MLCQESCRGRIAKPLPGVDSLTYMEPQSDAPAETQNVIRKQLLKAALVPNHQLTAVDVREICLHPGQKTGRHFHACTVIGYIVEGEAKMQVEGEPELRLPAGSAFHEPRGRTILRFDNASDTEPMLFVACYLLDGDQDLITMLPANP